MVEKHHQAETAPKPQSVGGAGTQPSLPRSPPGLSRGGTWGEQPLTDGGQGRVELNLELRDSEESANIQYLLPFLFPELLWEACPVSKGINSGTCHLSSPCPCVPTFETATSLI